MLIQIGNVTLDESKITKVKTKRTGVAMSVWIHQAGDAETLTGEPAEDFLAWWFERKGKSPIVDLTGYRQKKQEGK